MIKDKESHKKYWSDRAKAEGAKTVGFGGYDDEMFDKKTIEWTRKFTPFWEEYLIGKKLDFGCGIGRFTSAIGVNTIGLDLTASLLKIAKENNPHIEFVHMQDPEKLPFKDDSFQSIWCCTVLQHLVAPGMVQKIVEEFYRILRPDGRVLFYENTAFPDKKMGHIHFRGIIKYQEIFRDAGFENIQMVARFTEDADEKHTLFLAEK